MTERSEVTEQRYPTMAQTARNAHKLIDALATGHITGELAHAYLSADLQEDQLDAILKAHTKPAPRLTPGQITPPYPFSPNHSPGRLPFPPVVYPGIPGAVPTPLIQKKDPLSPPWDITCQAQGWPGAAIQQGKLVGGWIKPFQARYQPHHDSTHAEQDAP